MKHVPKINWIYWIALMSASIFGTNAGDFIANIMHLGHLNGLPYLAAALLIIFLIERFSPYAHVLYFWVAIVIIRASGTNIGDSFEDFGIGFLYSVPLSAALLVVSVMLWRYIKPPQPAEGIPINGYYWITMLFATVLGTVGGDWVCFGLGLGTLKGTLLMSIPLMMALYIGRNGLLTQLYYYWFAVSLVRTDGTAAGDFLMQFFGLVPATIMSGITFVVIIISLYAVLKNNVREQGLQPGSH